MDIGNEFEKKGVGINKDGLVSPLEQMPGPVQPAINPGGIAKGEILHDAGERSIAYLDGKMNMVGHQAVGMDTEAEFFDGFLQEKEKTIPVAIFKEDILPGIPAQDDMIESTGVMDALLAGHGVIILELRQ
jgi:hypothetical protein